MALRHFQAEDGTELAYRDEGEGLPVLALAGLTRNGSDFDYLAPHLHGVRLIRLDYRGRGGSGWSGAASYTVLQEGRDALMLLAHLGLDKAAVLGTSRGGLIGLLLAAVAHDRLLGLCLNDVGPVLEPGGLDRIKEYIGRNPATRSHEALAARLPAAMPGFANVPAGRWLEEARRHYQDTPEGLRVNYDPELRDAFLAAYDAPQVDAWPLFDAAQGLPLALIRGANSDLLSRETAAEMQRRRPDMVLAEVPDRAHIPFLDEPESLKAVNDWLALMR